MRRFLLVMILFMLAVGAELRAQGITTATISGLVVDEKGEILPGATIIAVHQPSGSKYGATTRGDGHFTIQNARVGGPYSITVTFVGYEPKEKNEVYLSLGNVTDIKVALSQTNTQLQEVVVNSTKDDVFNSERTGAATNIDRNSIQSVPNISRGLKDFTKLSPLANTSGNGTSFAGANNRYNQFAIDGLVNNDVFGLASSGTNGGQTGVEPISLDAIEEIQINIAPYDVRQGGFTGGGINAITKSGTNTFQGSVYHFGNSQALVGKNNPTTGENKAYPTYTDYQQGFRMGGPILKNKLFFFLNGELTRKKTPLAFVPGSTDSNITIAEADQIVSTLKSIAPTYNPGDYMSIDQETNSDKLLAKLDWNISDNHKLTLRHSYTYGLNIDNSRSANALRFYNNGVYFPSTTNSTGLELNSTFGSKSNRLLIGYTSVTDDRDPLGNPFPLTLINLTGGRTITFGSDNSSVANLLKQKIFSVTDDFTFYKGKHTFTIGTNNEFYSFYNLFVQNIYGRYAFKSLADFVSQASATKVAPTFYQVAYSFDTTDDPSQSKGAADFAAFQLGVYGQDEFQVSDKLKVTGGLRIDLPVFPDKPIGNDQFNTKYSGTIGETGTLPSAKVLWSPRVGFNLDVNGDKSLQVRGGTGLFTGRVPFVWVANQFSNNGQLNGTYSTGSSAANAVSLTNGLTYMVDPFNQPLPGKAPIASVTPGRGAINVISQNFKFPQVFRTNLALDKKLPWGLTATVEAIYSKTLNNINFINEQRQPVNSINGLGGDIRPRYTASNANPTNSGYANAGRIDPAYDEIVKLVNTNLGYSYNFVFQLQKQFEKGFSGSISYTYGDSKDVNSGTSSVAYSNWQFTNQVNGLNYLPLTTSNYSLGSRVVGLVSYKKSYLNERMTTQISLFYTGQSGQPFSYIYNGDLNNDGTSNDLIFIPKDRSQINLVDIQGGLTAQQQWDNLNDFIETSSYLREHRGEYAERNGLRTPFQNIFDVRILQDFAVKVGNSTNKIQLSFDILNVGNLLNKDWGKQYFVSNQTFSLINYVGLTDTDPTSGVNYSTNAPRFTYTAGGQTNGAAWSISDLASRWRGQFGLRYIFN